MISRNLVVAIAVLLIVLVVPTAAPAQEGEPVLVIRAGLLVDPEAGTATPNQVILVQGDRIEAVVSPGSVDIPSEADVIDLSDLTVLGGLVDTHNHLALTYKQEPESNHYYLTYVMDSTPLRAIQAVSNGMQMLSSGFTVVRDMGNNGN